MPKVFVSLSSVCQVVNPGKALQTLGSAYLNIMWPYELANEKWLLYPASLKFEGHPNTQCTLSAALNPLKLRSSALAELPSSFNHTVNRQYKTSLFMSFFAEKAPNLR